MYTLSLCNKIVLQTYVFFILRCQLGIVDLNCITQLTDWSDYFNIVLFVLFLINKNILEPFKCSPGVQLKKKINLVYL